MENTPKPKDGVRPESLVVRGLVPATPYYFALRAADEAQNWSELSNFAHERASIRTYPQLFIQPSAFGMRYWAGRNILDWEQYEAALGGVYEITLCADASWYGGTIAGISFAWDLTDIESQETDPEGDGALRPVRPARPRRVRTLTEAPSPRRASQ